MKKLNQGGYIEDVIMTTLVVVVFGILALVVLAIPMMLFSQWTMSEDNVSGIVYNTSNNSFIAENTQFAVRASVDTYIDPEHNASEYCLPKGSPYIDLVNRAAVDKDIKVQVTTRKGFWWKLPWTCIDNVYVEEIR
jgi:hypothetical protein